MKVTVTLQLDLPQCAEWTDAEISQFLFTEVKQQLTVRAHENAMYKMANPDENPHRQKAIVDDYKNLAKIFQGAEQSVKIHR